MRVRRTYLEMHRPEDLVPAREPDVEVEIREETACAPEVYRGLYLEVGRAHHWTDRADWSETRIAAHLARPDIRLWIARVDGGPAGYFELRRCDDASVEIAYFGLLPEFVGRGLGGHLLTVAAREAWALGAIRVWLHTNTMDHPAALPNYQRRGFRAARVEEFDV